METARKTVTRCGTQTDDVGESAALTAGSGTSASTHADQRVAREHISPDSLASSESFSSAQRMRNTLHPHHDVRFGNETTSPATPVHCQGGGAGYRRSTSIHRLFPLYGWGKGTAATSQQPARVAKNIWSLSKRNIRITETTGQGSGHPSGASAELEIDMGISASAGAGIIQQHDMLAHLSRSWLSSRLIRYLWLKTARRSTLLTIFGCIGHNFEQMETSQISPTITSGGVVGCIGPLSAPTFYPNIHI